jgi:hypothetical protein
MVKSGVQGEGFFLLPIPESGKKPLKSDLPDPFGYNWVESDFNSESNKDYYG